MDILSFIVSKRYIEDTLKGAGALAGKSAYDIACENGFKGTPTEWLASLQGDTPEISPNGTWVINGVDTGVIASPSLAGYATEEFVQNHVDEKLKTELSKYATRQELTEAILGIKLPDVSAFVTQKEIDAAIAAIVFPEPDLSAYALKSEIPDVSNFATTEFVQTKYDEILNSIPEAPSYDEIICDGGEI